MNPRGPCMNVHEMAQALATLKQKDLTPWVVLVSPWGSDPGYSNERICKAEMFHHAFS